MSDRPACYDKAAELLSRRPHFRRQLADKLRTRGYDADEIETALDRLARHGWLDDGATATAFVAQRLRRGPVGRRRLAAELVRRGAPAEAIDAALEELPRNETAAAREAAGRWAARRRGGADPRALARYLERQGFAGGAIVDALEEYRAAAAAGDAGEQDRRLWHKSDGKLFAFRPDLAAAWPQPFPGDRVAYCYDYPGRDASPGHCPTGGTVSWYNGTVEGTPALSPDGSALYVGRGDGMLYAVATADGRELWSFRTFNPLDPDDPDGGGEVIAAPLVAPDGTVYLATAAAGPYETNAVYALSPAGELLWRFPHAAASWENTFVASPALSPDGRTLYVGGSWGPAVDDWDVTVPGSVLAFDVAAPAGTGDDRLRWLHRPVNEGEFWLPTVWTTALAVGSDGTLYASGPEYTLGGGSAVAFALRDAGDRAVAAWERMVDLDRGRASFTLGLALREVAGVTTRVYASSGSVWSPLGQGYRAGGKLYALDPATGDELWEAPFDPEEHGGFGSMSGIAVDADGVIYTGVSGHRDGGTVYALGEDGSLLWSLPVTGLLEWGHPVIGPEGNLYFADTRRHACVLFPLESGACAEADVHPELYAIRRAAAGEPCVPGPETLCLGDGRFAVTVEWATAQGSAGNGRVADAGTRDSGLFWFFRESNWEMLVKVLDGCAVNDRFWVFFAATTNVEFTLRVRDTATGVERPYHNPAGHPADAVTDTAALATCP